MASTLRIKRRSSGSAGAPSTLKGSELAFNEVDSVLWYGKGADGNGDAITIEAIAGPGAFVSLSGNQTISGTKTVTGTLALTGATIDGFTTTGNVIIGGNLTVEGTTTTVNSTTVTVDDKNIELGSTASPTDAGADGGGLTLKGTTDKTIRWLNATDSWTYNQNVELESGYGYRIDGVEVLNKTTLGSSVVSSSLTSVGTLTSGTWQGTTIGVAYGGTGATSASAARTALGLAIGTDVQAYDAELAALAGLTSAADRLPYFTGSGTASLAVFSSFGRDLVDDADASAARTTLGLGTIATQNANNVSITGGSIDNINLDGGTY